jgi:hypothetical protein
VNDGSNNRIHVAKTNFSVRFGSHAGHGAAFAQNEHRFRVNAKTGTDGFFGRNDRKKGSSGNDKIPFTDNRPTQRLAATASNDGVSGEHYGSTENGRQ